MPDMNLAYKWAIDTCNAPNVGYSQAYRNQNTVGGITYYDCSSFIWYAMQNGDFDVEGAYYQVMGTAYSGNAIVTTYENQWLKALGFVEHNVRSNWERGDILWRSGHTEMVYIGGDGEGITMGAHTANTTLGNQVSINGSKSTYEKWSRIWRYPGGPPTGQTDWIKGNMALDLAQMRNNAALVNRFLHQQHKWTTAAVAGILGNMQKESWINPGVWQNLNPTDPDLGYGLVQWTPSTKITGWLTENNYDIDDGDGQLSWIDGETVNKGQWNETREYPISFEEFKKSTQSPEYLAYAFMYNFEQPSDLNQPDRQQYARYWYNYLHGFAPTPPTPNPPHPGVITSQKKMPIWMYPMWYHK